MKNFNNIPTLQADEFRQTLTSYHAPSLFEKESFNDFFILDLAAPSYKLKLPQTPYRFTANSLLILTNGKAVKSSGLNTYTLSKNSILQTPAGHISATYEISNNIEGFWLHFSNTFLSHTNIDISDWLAKPVIYFQESEMQNLVVLLKRIKALNGNTKNTELIKLYLATLLAEIKSSADFSQDKQFTAAERITLKFKQLLSFNTSKQKTVSFYAKKLNVSPNHLNKSVKTVLGKSASMLIDEMLLLEAKVLIRQNNISFSEIAFQVGFEDPSYFGRFFKKHSGYTPTEFRKMIDLSE